MPGVTVIEVDGGYGLFDVDETATASAVLRDAVARADVTDFSRQQPTLSQIFKEVIR